MILSSAPAAALRQLVRYYYQVEAYLIGETAVQPVPARSPLLLEFTFGEPYAVRRLDRGGTTRSAYPIALVGAQTYRRVELLLRGKVDSFAIAFQPGAISRLFSTPAGELTDDDFEGDVVLGRGLGELYRRLGGVSAFADRVSIADEYLCAKRAVSDRASDVARVALAVQMNSGCVRVTDLAHNSGLSVRQFERRFRHEIGIAPKLYARIVRFEVALRRKATRPMTPWADIAHELGYHDQMHMVHDFNRLSGGSPSAMCGQLDMFVKPEVAAATGSR